MIAERGETRPARPGREPKLAIDFGFSTGVRPSSEAFRRLDITALRRGGLLVESAPVAAVTWTDGAWIVVRGGDGSIELLYSVRAAGEEWQEVREHVPLEWSGCNYGGGRPWFSCPGCGRRSRTLYGGKRFLCRLCSGFAYATCREEPWERKLRRAQDIRMGLGGDGNACAPLPPRPKGMHERTYRRLRYAYEAARLAALRGAVATIR